VIEKKHRTLSSIYLINDAIASKNLPNVYTWAAPGKESKSTTHGGFDDDQVTMARVIALMKWKTP
jgi:hypothetical protein